MQTTTGAATEGISSPLAPKSDIKPTVFRILFIISFVHLINDTIQSIIPAILPLLKDTMQLTYLQTGIIFFALNMTSSLLQPVVGLYSDRKPSPYLLPLGMVLTSIGVLGIGLAPNYWMVLLSVLFIGFGSAAFHPEASRVAYMAAGPRRGLAQSIFQVGGNSGTALAPIMTAMIFAPLGQLGAVWFTVITVIGIGVQTYIARWYTGYIAVNKRPAKKASSASENSARKKQVGFAFGLLIFLLFIRTWYQSGITIYYPFELMEKFGISLQQAQIYIFMYAGAGAVGTLFGGPLSDRFGRKNVLFFSIFGSIPLALALPYADPVWAYVLLLLNGFILLSGWSVAVVYAQELFPGKIGTVSGLTTGLAFGLGALGAVALGGLIDAYGLKIVLKVISFLPLIGLVTWLLPSDQKLRQWASE